MDNVINIIKNNYWKYIIGLIAILLLLLIQLAHNIDINTVHNIYKEQFERCNCFCPEQIQTGGINYGIINTNYSINPKEPGG